MKTFQLIRIKYLAPTNTQGARIKLINKHLAESVTLQRDYSCEPLEQAVNYLQSKNIEIVGRVSDSALVLEPNQLFISIKS